MPTEPPLDPATPAEVIERMQRPDARFGKYVLVHQLGEGGMGTVHRAWDRELSRWVALKFLREASDEEQRQRFDREARLLASVDHPGIIPVYETGRLSDRHFIAMKLVEGRSLDRDRPASREAARFVMDAARAVHAAHERGIVHRDLKPGNILVEKETGRVYVGDFGLARSTRPDPRLTASGAVVGTPVYMSPEQALGWSLDARSDVYALGATLYTLVTGALPFDGHSAMDIARKVASEDPTPPRKLVSTVPTELETIVLKAMAKEPPRRYATALELAEDLRRYLDGEPIQAKRVSVLYWIRRKVAKHRGATVMGAVAALALGALAAYLLHAGSIRSHEEAEAKSYFERAEESKDPAERLVLFERAGLVLPEARRRATRLREELGRKAEALEKAKPYFDQGLDRFRSLERSLVAGSPDEASRAAREAESFFQTALDTCPDYAEAALQIARVRQEMDDYPGARDEASKAIAIAPQLATAYLLRAIVNLTFYEELRHRSGGGVQRESAESRKLMSEITDDLARVRRWNRDVAELDYARGILAFAEGRYGESAEALAKYLGTVPAEWRARELLAHALLHAGRFRDADLEATQALKVRPRSIVALANRGTARVSQGDRDGALADFEAVLGISPGHSDALLGRAAVRVAQGRSKEAIDDYTSILAKDASNLVAWNNRSIAYYRAGNWQGAIGDATAALKLDPGNADTLRHRALARSSQGDHLGAMEDDTSALTSRPDFPEAWNDRAIEYAALGNYPAAMRDVDRAVELRPSFAEAYHNRGVFRSNQGDERAALADFNRAIAANPSYANAYLSRAGTKKELKDYEGAIADATKSLELQPGQPDALALRGMSRLLRGEEKKSPEVLRAAALDFQEGLKLARAHWAYRAVVENNLKFIRQRLQELGEEF